VGVLKFFYQNPKEKAQREEHMWGQVYSHLSPVARTVRTAPVMGQTALLMLRKVHAELATLPTTEHVDQERQSYTEATKHCQLAKTEEDRHSIIFLEHTGGVGAPSSMEERSPYWNSRFCEPPSRISASFHHRKRQP
jgi:hypothetical protein